MATKKIKPETIPVKSWFRSKTKWAGVLTALSFVIPALISWLNGEVSFGSILPEIYTAIIAILAIFGIRDAINKNN